MFQKDNNCQKILNLQTLNYSYLLKDTKSRYIQLKSLTHYVLFKCIAFLYFAVQGKIELKGQEINKESPRNTQQLDYRAR